MVDERLQMADAVLEGCSDILTSLKGTLEGMHRCLMLQAGGATVSLEEFRETAHACLSGIAGIDGAMNVIVVARTEIARD